MKDLANKVYELSCLFILSAVAAAIGIVTLVQEPAEAEPDYFCSMDMYVELPEISYPEVEIVYPEVLDGYYDLKQELGSITFPKKRIVLEDSHRMFITAYCSAECGGSTMTSSGATVHRSDDPYEPTTCAIDRRYFSYGDLFYVPSEDRVYIAEDTGSAVKGLHIDLFQNSMSEVMGYNTRYETIYRCEFEEYEVILSNYDIREQINYYYFGKRGER